MMTSTIYIVLIVSIVGLIALALAKSLGRPLKYSYILARGFICLLGVGIGILGIYVSSIQFSYAQFASVFCYITGAQVSLWALGISDEILGNEPAVASNKDGFFMSVRSFEYGLAFISTIVVGLFVIDQFGSLRIFPKEMGFIKQVNAESNLARKPNWVTVSVKSIDSLGKEVAVDIGILWDPYRWVKGSTDYVAIDEGEKARFRVEDIIKDFEPSEKRPIITVGVASHENAAENPELEIERAQKRADKLVVACNLHFYNKPHLYSLNLGAFKANNGLSMFSAVERRVILIVINKGEDSRDLTSGIKNALIEARVRYNYLFDPSDYSLFDTTRFQVVRR